MTIKILTGKDFRICVGTLMGCAAVIGKANNIRTAELVYAMCKLEEELRSTIYSCNSITPEQLESMLDVILIKASQYVLKMK